MEVPEEDWALSAVTTLLQKQQQEKSKTFYGLRELEILVQALGEG